MGGSSSGLTLQLRGTLRGHNGWVTQIATNPKDENILISASRGKNYQDKVLYWYYLHLTCFFIHFFCCR